MSGFTKVAAFVAAYKERIATIAVGHTFNAVFDHIYNYWIYFPVIAIYGPLKGGVMMALGDVCCSYLFLRFYDRSKKDWLGIEEAREASDFAPRWLNKRRDTLVKKILIWPFVNVARIVSWSFRRGKVAAFFALSIFTDPFITTVYCRKGSFNGMTKKDWMIFWSSAVVTNTYWTIRAFIILSLGGTAIRAIF